MNKITSFLRDKGFYLALLACILAAAVSSFWAIRKMMQRLDTPDQPTQPQEELVWDIPEMNAEVDQKVDDIPKPSASSPPPSGSSSQPAVQQPSGTSSGQDGSGTAPSAAEEAAASFVQPVSGPVSKEFSGDELVYSETLRDWRTHNGVDISCAEDAAVKSCSTGEVTAIYEDGNWGQVVEITADEVVYRYAGLAANPLVSVGDEVRPGTRLGSIGPISAESAEPTHLHFEVLKGGNAVDPMPYLAG